MNGTRTIGTAAAGVSKPIPFAPAARAKQEKCRVRIIDLIFAIENQLLCFPENDVFVTE